MQAKLRAYAQAGGIVVINAKQLSGTAHESLTGVKLTGTAQASGTITWDADASTTTEGTYKYSTVTRGTATVLAHSGTSTPQVTKNVVGAGEVWVTLPDYLSNSANNATLNLGAKVVGTLVGRFASATVASTGANTVIDYAVNDDTGSNRLGTAVTIINNDTAGRAWTGTITFAQGAGTVSEWIADTAVSCSTVAGKVTCNVSVPANDVKVFALNRSSSTCVPQTCASLGKTCGSVSNGCGGTLSCGTCASGSTCSSANVCVATPPATNLFLDPGFEAQTGSSVVSPWRSLAPTKTAPSGTGCKSGSRCMTFKADGGVVDQRDDALVEANQLGAQARRVRPRLTRWPAALAWERTAPRDAVGAVPLLLERTSEGRRLLRPLMGVCFR